MSLTKEILHLLPVLAIAIAMNTGAGLYYNIGKQKLGFDWNTLLCGVIKALIAAGMFLGTSYCFEATDLSSIGITPYFIMNSAIVLYVSKSLILLGKILGVDIKSK